MERTTWKRGLDGMEDIGLRDGVTVGDAVCRLADYEDTGLEPEEITTLLNPPNAPLTLEELWKMDGEPAPDFGTAIALIHSELSEALEEMRAGNEVRPGTPAPMICYSGGGYVATEPTKYCKKPEGVAIELVDAVIRIADLCGHMGIDLESAIALKMKYNEGRPFKHGKLF